MKKLKIKYLLAVIFILTMISCEDFLEKAPLDQISMETFWQTEEHAEMWINDLYAVGIRSDISLRGLKGHLIVAQDCFSDDAYGRATWTQNSIANGTFEPTDARITAYWNYSYIRKCHEFFENIDKVKNISDEKYDELAGQARFFLAYEYYKMMTRFRDIPLITKVATIPESDIPKSPKAEVLEYILQQLDMAIEMLPLSYPGSDVGRITKGAALFLKTRVLLYNERWAEAAATAQQVMDLNIYKLHPNFEELFLAEFDNKKEETILEVQYTEGVKDHYSGYNVSPVKYRGGALAQPTPQLVNAFWMKDGLPIDESPLYNPKRPFDNRDPRFYNTFLWHGQTLNETTPPLDLAGTEASYSFTYVYFKKYAVDFRDGYRFMHNNLNLFRYADLLLMYAEAKNEASGHEASIYGALDMIRERAGMPLVDRTRYSDQASLRSLIRHERRVELAQEGYRYNDIIRWRIAENVLNINLTSMDLSEWEDGPVDANGNPVLIVKPVETRIFNPNRHYVWPIPQTAIDRSTKLVQHTEWQ